MNKTTTVPFQPYEGHRAMTKADALIFERAAQFLQWPDLYSTMNHAGAKLAHHYHFSREKCGGRPINAWAREQDHDAVATALEDIAKQLKGLPE